MDLERAKTVALVAQTVINSAKVECDFLEITGAKGSGFIPHDRSEETEQPRGPRLVKSGP